MPLISRMVSLFGLPLPDRKQIPSLRNESEFQPLNVKDQSVSVASLVQDILQRLFLLMRASDRQLTACNLHVHGPAVCLPFWCLSICMSRCVCMCVLAHAGTYMRALSTAQSLERDRKSARTRVPLTNLRLQWSK